MPRYVNQGSGYSKNTPFRSLIAKEGKTCEELKLFGDNRNIAFRIIPQFDDQGLVPCLNGDFDPTESKTNKGGVDYIPVLGDVFVVCSTLRVWNQDIKREFSMAAAILPEDKEGNPVVTKFSPQSQFHWRLGWKIHLAGKFIKAGLQYDVPPEWLRWSIHRPRNIFVYGVVTELNGKALSNREPELIVLPGSALPTFLSAISKKNRENGELSHENCRFGDFYSMKDGHDLEVEKIGGNGEKVGYTICLGRERPLTREYVQKYMIEDTAELINIPYIEDAMEILSGTFGAEAVDYAFREDPILYKYVPKHVKGAAEDISEPLTKAEYEEIQNNPALLKKYAVTPSRSSSRKQEDEERTEAQKEEEEEQEKPKSTRKTRKRARVFGDPEDAVPDDTSAAEKPKVNDNKYQDHLAGAVDEEKKRKLQQALSAFSEDDSDADDDDDDGSVAESARDRAMNILGDLDPDVDDDIPF